MQRIASILPKGEGFSPRQFGAIALCVRDFTLYSRWRADTVVVGGIPSEGFAGIRYVAPPGGRWYENRTRAYARGCAALVKRESIALAEIHNRPILLKLMARHTSCRLALHLHNDPQEMDETRTPGERLKLLAGCGGIYCVSSYIRSRFLEGLPPEAAAKLHVIYNGIPLPAALPPKEKLLVYAGRMTEGKGALLLAQALRIALPQLPDWRAVLIGSRRHEAGRPLTGHEREIIETLSPLGAQGQLPGFLTHEETLGLFARAHIAAAPSLWQEPFGRTALEALAYGCALISSGRGGLSEITGDAAYIPPALTAEGLAEAILHVAHNEAERARLQAAGRERAKRFAIEHCTAALDTARAHILAEAERHVA